MALQILYSDFDLLNFYDGFLPRFYEVLLQIHLRTFFTKILPSFYQEFLPKNFTKFLRNFFYQTFTNFLPNFFTKNFYEVFTKFLLNPEILNLKIQIQASEIESGDENSDAEIEYADPDENSSPDADNNSCIRN